MANPLLNFRYGVQASLPTFSHTNDGDVFITTDSHRMFVVLPDKSDYVGLGDFHLVSYAGSDTVTAASALANLPSSIKRTNILYLTVDTANANATALYRYDGAGFVAISNTVEIAQIKSDIEALQTAVNGITNDYVKKSGSTMTGALILNADPTASSNAKQAATKNYVDTAKASAISTAAADATTKANAVLGTENSEQGSATVHGVLKTAKANETAISNLQDDLKDAKDDIADKAPIDHAATATTYGAGTASKYGHVKVSDSTNGTNKAANSVAASEYAVAQAYKKASDTLGTANDTADKNTVYGAKAAAAAAQSKADSAMPKAGGTFTGNVTMGDGKTLTVNTPSADAHAATKKYVDDAAAGTLSDAAKDAQKKADAVLGTASDTADKNTVYGAKAAAAAAQSKADSAYNLADKKAPINHAVNANTYGLGTSSVYGHVKLSDSISSTSAASAGIAATPKAVKDAKEAVIGTGSDTKDNNTVYGAKAYAKDMVDSLSSSVNTLKENIGNLTNIMNFLGTTTTEIKDGETTSINKPSAVTDSTYTAAKGDVVVDKNGKECVYDGSVWRLIGDTNAQNTAISDLEKRMGDAEKDIDDLEAAVGTNDNKGNLFTRVSNLETWEGTHKTEFNNLSGTVTNQGTSITNLQNTVGTKPSTPTMDNTLWEEVADLRADLGEKTATAGTTTAFARIKQAETHIGATGDAASATGSIYARIKYNYDKVTAHSTAIGSANDAANASGSLYARIKDNYEAINGLTTLLTWSTF